MITYVMCYDTASSAVNQRQLDAFIASNKFIDEWSFAFNGCYFIKSNTDVETLNGNLNSFFAEARFVLVRLRSYTRQNLNGRLADPVWKWIAGANDEQFANAIRERAERANQK